MPDEIKTVIVTPTFNYQEHTEIIKRFVERVTVATSVPFPTGDDFMDFVDYIRAALPYVRNAVSELLADDVLAQIKKGTFPIRGDSQFHEFIPFPEPDQDICEFCGLDRGGKLHLFA